MQMVVDALREKGKIYKKMQEVSTKELGIRNRIKIEIKLYTEVNKSQNSNHLKIKDYRDLSTYPQPLLILRIKIIKKHNVNNNILNLLHTTSKSCNLCLNRCIETKTMK